MADKKISALTSATTPLAGTEVLPIVQSGATVKVPVSDLTAGRAISATAVTASTGNFIVGTAGQGVDFSIDPAAAGMTSELLDDYEEGTWTPSVTSSGGTITLLGAVSGVYTKVGRLVHTKASIAITVNGTGSGFIRITGWPFTVSNGMVGTGVDAGVTGKTLVLYYASAGTMLSSFYDGTYPGANTALLQFSMTFEV
jgi:hypothetical protein